MKATLHSCSPLIPSGIGSFTESLEFYTQQMGFVITWQDRTIAGIERDEIAFTVVENSTKEWVENSSFSIGVSNVDALHEEYQANCTSAHVGLLEIKVWGRREFHLIAPSGVCFQFYQQEV